MRKSFQDKKPGRSSGVWQRRGVWLLPGSKPRAQVPFCAAPAAPRPSLGVVLQVGIAEQRAEQAQDIQEPLSSGLHVHTQARRRASWQPGITQHSWQGSECPAGPREPSLCPSLTHQGQFWLGQSLGPVQKSGCCVPSDLLPPPPAPGGVTGAAQRFFSRDGTAPGWICNPQQSHTQRNSRARGGGDEPVTHTGSSCFIPSLPTLHLPAANKRKFRF